MGEGSVFDWLSVAALGATAVVALAGAFVVPGGRWRFALLGAILGFLAVDDPLGLALLVCALAARALAALVTATGLALAQWEKTLGLAAMHDAELLAWLLLASGLAACVARAATP